jgi:SAM-dependent methyltransferase
LAAEYDEAFTESAIGRALRALVWARLEHVFNAPGRILELGCGTGEDALCLARRGVGVVAVDASSQMVNVARQKAAQRGLLADGADSAGGGAARAEFHCLPMESVGSVFAGHAFDGVLSNFGAVNCVPDLGALINDVAPCLRPGAHLVWVVMGRHVPWEWAWFLSQGDWSKAWRRLTPGGVSWRGLNIRYPTPGKIAGLLRPHFSVERIAPLGVALPPSYAGEWLARRPRLSKVLTKLEYRAQNWSALARVADHYIVEATRLDVGARA